MKKILIILMLLVSFSGIAQKGMSKVFDGKTKIVFLGLDFTQARFIGQDDFKDTYKLKTYYLANWNILLEEEYQKYNLPMLSLNANNYLTETSDLILLNDEIEDIDFRVINGSYSITENDVKKSIKKYPLTQKEGIGVSLVVESFNSPLEKAVYWVTFINLNNGSLLYTERMEAKANGFGIRNFWAGSIVDIITQIKDSRYRVWKRKF
mgnify:CR=1 FL=1